MARSNRPNEPFFIDKFQNGKISVKVAIDTDNNKISYHIVGDPKSTKANVYHEIRDAIFTLDGVNNLFDQMVFRIKDDLLWRSDDPNYFNHMEIWFTDSELTFNAKIDASKIRVIEVLKQARDHCLDACKEYLSNKSTCTIF